MLALLFDTETTGLPDNSGKALALQPQVIEFYGVIVDTETGLDIEELEFLADPGKKLPDVITRITGITDELLLGAKPFGEHLGSLRRFFKRADVAVAHNLAFDKKLITFEMQRLVTELEWPAKLLCTVEATEHIKGHRLSLALLYEHLFSETFPGAHRARADVTALKRCYLELLKRGIV